ncbi:MAG: universal stress protein [Halolamina sp.]
MTKNVLVPIDGSPLSDRALGHGLAEFAGASITVLHVIDVFEPGYGADPDFETTDEPLMGTEEWYERAGEISAELFEESQDIADEFDRPVISTAHSTEIQVSYRYRSRAVSLRYLATRVLVLVLFIPGWPHAHPALATRRYRHPLTFPGLLLRQRVPLSRRDRRVLHADGAPGPGRRVCPGYWMYQSS